MARSAVRQIRELDEQRAKLIAAAKSEAIKRVDQALKELNELGFNYRLVTEDSRAPKGTKARAGRRRGMVKNGLCKICNFRTVPPHDARTHRAQSKKAPLTGKELAERGLRRH